jgi:hypothetical protein
MKSKCELCTKKKNLFEVMNEGKEIKACSVCITDNLLTGWSK